MRAAVAVGADVNHERAVRHLDFIGAEQNKHVEGAERRHLRRAQAARAARKADIERADPRSGIVQKAKPFQSGLTAPKSSASFAASATTAAPSCRAVAAGSDQHDWMLRPLQHLRKGMLAGGEFAERVGARAEIVVRIGEIGPGADQTDFELAAAPALADARVENGRPPGAGSSPRSRARRPARCRRWSD
jgi:hypothetical protein